MHAETEGVAVDYWYICLGTVITAEIRAKVSVLTAVANTFCRTDWPQTIINCS